MTTAPLARCPLADHGGGGLWASVDGRALGVPQVSAALALVRVGAEWARAAQARACRSGPGAMGVIVGRVCGGKRTGKRRGERRGGVQTANEHLHAMAQAHPSPLHLVCREYQ